MISGVFVRGRKECQSQKRRCDDRIRGHNQKEICRCYDTGFEGRSRGHEPSNAYSPLKVEDASREWILP